MAKETRKAKGAGSVYQKNGAWVAQVHDGYKENGRPRYRQAQRKTQAEAVKALKEIQAKVTLGSPIADGRDSRLATWLDSWLEDHVKPNREPKTHDFYRLQVERRIKPLLGRMELRKVKTADVQRMMRAVEEAGATKSTVSAVRRTLRAAYSVAVKQGLCVSNPVVNTASPKVRAKPKVYFDGDQAQALLAALRGSSVEGLVRFALATGLRVGEATGLAWAHVDLDRRAFRVERQLQRVEGVLVLKELKTEKSRRTLPLVGHSLDAVRDEKARQAVEGWENELGLVFLNPFGRPFDPKYVDERMKEALKAAGLPATGMHSLRHSAATFMLMGGLNLHQVSRYLGHSQIALTANLYGHVLDESMRDAAVVLQHAYAPE